MTNDGEQRTSAQQTARLSSMALGLSACALLALAAAGCEPGGGAGPGPAASTSARAPSAQASAAPSGAGSAAAAGSAAPIPSGVVVGIPYLADKVASTVDPKGEAPYAGPTGTLRGRVTITGDAPPLTPGEFPAKKCGEAAATYGKLFRVGQDGALADAMVAVTGYKGYVPPRDPAAKITIHGCALSRRTVAMTFGQRLEVANLDKIETYMPYLDGAVARATMVAIPGGDGVRLYPQQPGHYMLRDELPKPFMTADVFVLAYATHAVTDLDGQYEIPDIPVGDVAVNAYLPAADRTIEKRITIAPGVNSLDLTLEYRAAAKDAGAPKKP